MTVHSLLLVFLEPNFKFLGSRMIPKTCNVSSALSLPFDFPHSDSVTLMASFHLTLRLSFLSPTQSTSVSVRFGQFNNFADCAAYAFTNVSTLALLSEPAVHGDHILLQWPFVCSSGTSASVGLRPHCHTTACNHYQPRWAKTQCKSIKLDRLIDCLQC